MPSLSLTAVCTPPTCDGLETFTVTPGKTPPVVSLTVPVRVAVCTACANSGTVATPQSAHASTSTGTTRFHFMLTPFAPHVRHAWQKRTLTDSPMYGRKYT